MTPALRANCAPAREDKDLKLSLGFNSFPETTGCTNEKF